MDEIRMFEVDDLPEAEALGIARVIEFRWRRCTICMLETVDGLHAVGIHLALPHRRVPDEAAFDSARTRAVDRVRSIRAGTLDCLPKFPVAAP